jgi:hypothetical protein
MTIQQYFVSRESELLSCPFLLSLDFHSQLIDSTLGYLKAKLTFSNNSKLFLFELVDLSDRKPKIEKYRYHYQNAKGKLIFRWDNAPHFPKLKSFPHHLHVGNKVIESHQPDLQEVLHEVIRHMEK